MRPLIVCCTASVLLLTTSLDRAATAAEPAAKEFWRATGANAAVAAGGREAADAAINVLRRGGNAADASVAALLVLSVTDSRNFCFGGEVPIIVYDAKRDAVEVVCGQGTAPRLATVEYFEEHKNGKIPGNGDPTTAAVPGAFGAYLTVLDRNGTMTFSELAQPALTLADRHQEGWQKDLARQLRRLMEAESGGPGNRRQGLQRVADCFYRGEIARELDEWSKTNGGLLRYEDLASHVTRVEPPVALDYRGHTIYKCGPWTQGPYLLQTLRLLEKHDLKALGHNQADFVHLLVESMKLALADRDTYYGDPTRVKVPLRQLLSKQYADLRRPLIDMQRASLEQRPGDPVEGRALLGIAPRDYQASNEPAKDTTTCLVADSAGNVIAATPSGWGGVVAGDTGIVLGSRLRSLNTWPGHPNCIEPGKRPRITLTPTIVFKNGKPVAAISVAGGDKQDQVTLQLLLNHIEFSMDPPEAVTAPRFVTDHLVGSFNQPPPRPGSLAIYETAGGELIESLRERGHDVRVTKPPLGHPVMLTIDPTTGHKRAAGDPKAGRHARAF